MEPIAVQHGRFPPVASGHQGGCGQFEVAEQFGIDVSRPATASQPQFAAGQFMVLRQKLLTEVLRQMPEIDRARRRRAAAN